MKDYDIIVKMSTPAFNEDNALDRCDWILNFIQILSLNLLRW